MIRIFLIYVLPLIAPTLVYLLWRLWQLKRGTGDAAADAKIVMRRAPWVKLAAIGTALLAVTLLIAALTGGQPANQTYVPPRVEDGRVLPGETLPDPAPPPDPASP